MIFLGGAKCLLTHSCLSKQVRNMACSCKTGRKLSVNVMEITVLVIVLCIIVALFSLPIVFYYVSVSIILHFIIYYFVYTLLGLHKLFSCFSCK